MTRRREVRVTEQFFDDLDDQLADERGTNGEPSATDFLVMDLPAIVETFAERFEELPEAHPGVPIGRIAIGAGVLVSAFAVYGVELAGGAIELVGIDIDL